LNPFAEDEFGQRARSLRLDTLVQLRWLAAAGQAATMLVACFGLGVKFPLGAGLLCVAASGALNVGLRWRFPVSYRLSDDFATYLLGFDILQLAAVLFLSGGLANPFSIFFLAPVATSAVSLPWRNALMLLGLSLFCDTVLEFWSLPLELDGGQPLTLPPLINVALWFAYGLSAVFVAIYGNRVASEARQLASALNATELILARAQHLSQLDGLAAAAAHELGTPLATVQLVVHELAAQPKIAELCADDLNLAEEQIARCRTILGKLSSPAEMADHALDEGGLANFIEEIAAPRRLQDIEIEVEVAGEGPEPSCRRNPAILYGLTNLIENAVGFAASRVTIQGSWTPAEVRIVIADDGPGFPAQVLAHLGEPYISDRAAARRGEEEPAGGLGLGLFIAKALLERSGARLTIANAATIGRGAVATIAWPFTSFEQAGTLARPNALELPE
jgi:two-component system sensor histidine kinase RegB